MVLHGFPQTDVDADYRASSDLELDARDWPAGRKLARPTSVLWGRAYLGWRNTIEARPWCTTVTGLAIKANHFLAEETPQARLAARVPLLKARAGSDRCCHQVLLG